MLIKQLLQDKPTPTVRAPDFRLFRLVFSAGIVFFSHNKSVNNVFQPACQHSRTGPLPCAQTLAHGKGVVCRVPNDSHMANQTLSCACVWAHSKNVFLSAGFYNFSALSKQHYVLHDKI
jgi:hypothetical protein